MKYTPSAAEPRVPGARSWSLRRLPLTKLALVLMLVLAAGSVLSALRGGAATEPLQDDVELATRTLTPRLGVDERVELDPAGAAGGDGVVEPVGREIRVAAPVPGKIAAVLVAEGARVAEGDALVQLENGPERAGLAAAEAELGIARANLTKALRGSRREDVEAAIAEAEAARARAALSEDARLRTEKLAEGGAATPDQLEKARRQAQMDAQSAEAAEARRRAVVSGSRYEDVLAAKARVASAEAMRDQAQAMLDRLTIRAPRAGEVLEINYRVGEYETPGVGKDGLLVLGDTRALRVRLDIDERDVEKVSLGARAFVTSNAYPTRKYAGRVVEVGHRMGKKNVSSDDPTARLDTKVLEVLVALDAHEGLLPGLRVSGYVLPERAAR